MYQEYRFFVFKRNETRFACIQGILECVKNISKCVLVSLTMDGDFHVVAEAGMSKVGVAFPCFDVFSGDGNAPSFQVLQSQYVFIFFTSIMFACMLYNHTRMGVLCRICLAGIEERLEEAAAQNRAHSMEMLVIHFSQVLKSIQSTNPVRVLCGMSTDLSYMHVVPSYKRESSIYDDVSNSMSLDYKIPAIAPM